MAKFSNINTFPDELSKIQHEVLTGGLLGDMHMSLDGKYPRIKVDRQFLDRHYLEYQFDIFKDFCKSEIKDFSKFDKRYNTNYKYSSFRTRSVPAFLDYYNKWYIDKVKVVPNIELTPTILAIWFCDDGSVAKVNSQIILKFSTESFGYIGAKFLSDMLEDRYKSPFPIYKKYKDKDQYIIKASTKSSNLFIEDIDPIMKTIPMSRKSDIWLSGY